MLPFCSPANTVDCQKLKEKENKTKIKFSDEEILCKFLKVNSINVIQHAKLIHAQIVKLRTIA